MPWPDKKADFSVMTDFSTGASPGPDVGQTPVMVMENLPTREGGAVIDEGWGGQKKLARPGRIPAGYEGSLLRRRRDED